MASTTPYRISAAAPGSFTGSESDDKVDAKEAEGYLSCTSPYRIAIPNGVPRQFSARDFDDDDEDGVRGQKMAVCGLKELVQAVPKSLLQGLPAMKTQSLGLRLLEADFERVPAGDLQVKFSNTTAFVQRLVIGTAYESHLKHPPPGHNVDCSRRIKRKLEQVLGGLWIVMVGDDFGCLFAGKEFSPQTLVHFSVQDRGFLAYQPRLA